jgi:YVTN family beta-propeller protein
LTTPGASASVSATAEAPQPRPVLQPWRLSGAAGVVADEGTVLVTNRGSAQLAVVDAETLRIYAIHPTGPRPNGAAYCPALQLATVATAIRRLNSISDQLTELDYEMAPVFVIIGLKREELICR